jgi:hypothetical protein
MEWANPKFMTKVVNTNTTFDQKIKLAENEHLTTADLITYFSA